MSTQRISRAVIHNAAQVGIEAVSGTQVPANYRLNVEIDVDPITPTQQVKSAGAKAPVDQLVEKDYTEVGLKGMLEFNDLTFFLRAGLCVPTRTGNTYLYVPKIYGADTLDTLSVEYGSFVAAESFAYGNVADIGLEFGEKGASFKGKMSGRRLQRAITMTPNPTQVPSRVVAPTTLDVFVGDSLTNLVQLDTGFKALWGMKGRQSGVITMDSRQPSYSYTVESELGMSASITIEEEDVVSAGYMADLLSSTQRYLRILAKGPEIGTTGEFYAIQVDVPFKFKADKRGAEQKVYAGTYALEPIYDPTFYTEGGAIAVSITTDFAIA